MCRDIVGLRRGDHSAQRLLLERERTTAAARDEDMKWKRKIIVGLETLMEYVKKRLQAKAVLDELARQVHHPFDPTESDRIKPTYRRSPKETHVSCILP